MTVEISGSAPLIVCVTCCMRPGSSVQRRTARLLVLRLPPPPPPLSHFLFPSPGGEAWDMAPPVGWAGLLSVSCSRYTQPRVSCSRDRRQHSPWYTIIVIIIITGRIIIVQEAAGRCPPHPVPAVQPPGFLWTGAAAQDSTLAQKVIPSSPLRMSRKVQRGEVCADCSAPGKSPHARQLALSPATSLPWLFAWASHKGHVIGLYCTISTVQSLLVSCACKNKSLSCLVINFCWENLPPVVPHFTPSRIMVPIVV